MVASEAQGEDDESEKVASVVGATEYTSQVVLSVLSTGNYVPEQWIEQDEESTSLERLLREIDIVYKMGHDVGALEDSKWVKNETT